jgi:regulator of RNase E activity RraA
MADHLPPISNETLEILKTIPTPTLIDALWVMKWPPSYIHGARPLHPDMKMAGRAVTLRFVPWRNDIWGDMPKGLISPEYVAFEKCGPYEVLVASAIGPWESIGGDIKFLRLKQLQVGGLVTDGSVRDSTILKGYGYPVYSHSTTAKQGPAVMVPWGVNDTINCGGVLVRPGDAIVGDEDGVVVVPHETVDDVIRIAQEREEIEEVVKAELEANPGPPGRYYPFNENTWKLYEEKTGKKPMGRG